MKRRSFLKRVVGALSGLVVLLMVSKAKDKPFVPDPPFQGMAHRYHPLTATEIKRWTKEFIYSEEYQRKMKAIAIKTQLEAREYPVRRW